MKRLQILWLSDSVDTFFNMVSMYAENSIRNQWWDEVNIIIWGASAKLAGSDTRIQTELMELMNTGVTVEACRRCAEIYDVADTLERLGIIVRFMGEPLTGYLQSGDTVLSV